MSGKKKRVTSILINPAGPQNKTQRLRRTIGWQIINLPDIKRVVTTNPRV